MKLIKEEVNQKNKYEKLFDEMLEYMEFRLVKYPDGTFGLIDLQGGNLGNIEDDRFDNAVQLLDRLDIYYDDYFINPIADELKDKGIESFHKDFSIIKFRDELPDSEWDFDVLDMVINHPNDIDLNNCYREDDLIGESLKEAKENFDGMTIEEIFWKVAGHKFPVFKKDGTLTKQAEHLYGKAAKAYGEDAFDKLCADEHCFKESLKEAKENKIILNDAQKKFIYDALNWEEVYRSRRIPKELLGKEWYITTDKSLDPYAEDGDGFPWVLIIDGEYNDALGNEFADEIINCEGVASYRGKKKLKESKQLNEGTSNFWTQEGLPLYAFLTTDEVADRVRERIYSDDEYDEDNEDSYYELEDKYYDELYKDGYAVISLDDGELEDAIDKFNDRTRELSYEAYDKYDDLNRKWQDGRDTLSDEELDKIMEEANQWYDASDYLEGMKLKIKDGYYEGAQLYLDGWNRYAIAALPEEVKKDIVDRYNKIGNDFGLMKLGVSYAFSNGETGYHIIKESKKLTERRWNAVIKAGIELRDALDEGNDLERVREAILACYDELYDKGLIDEYDHDDWTEEVRDYDFDNEDDIDFELGQLYDLCDNIGAFLAVTEADLDESLSQEIGQAYRELSAKYGVDADKLVSEFMKAKYPKGFPDFNGDVIYSEKYWNEFVDWCKQEKGVNLGESCKSKKALKESANTLHIDDLNTNDTRILDAGQYYTSLELPDEAYWEDDWNKTKENLKRWDKWILECARPVIENALHEVSSDIKLVGELSYYHPAKYNFETDRIYFDVELPKETLDRLVEENIKKPEFLQFLKDHYTSRDGFWSHMANNSDGFMKQDDLKKLTSILAFNLSDSFDDRQRDFVEEVVYDWYDLEVHDEEDMDESLKESEDDTKALIDFLNSLKLDDEVEEKVIGDWTVNAWTTEPGLNFSRGFYIVQIDNDKLNKHFSIPDCETQEELEYKRDRVIKDRLGKSLKEGVSEEILKTPRGDFKIYKGTWRDFKNEADFDDWGFWFDHSIPEDAVYSDIEKWYKIMHNHKNNNAIAVLYKDFTNKGLKEGYFDTDFDNKKVRNEIIGWWDAVERWNADNDYPYDIDNGDKEHATAQEVEEMLIAMWDMLLALRDEQKDSDEAKALLRRGKHIYNKYAGLSQFNESVHTEKVEEGIDSVSNMIAKQWAIDDASAKKSKMSFEQFEEANASSNIDKNYLKSAYETYINEFDRFEKEIVPIINDVLNNYVAYDGFGRLIARYFDDKSWSLQLDLSRDSRDKRVTGNYDGVRVNGNYDEFGKYTDGLTEYNGYHTFNDAYSLFKKFNLLDGERLELECYTGQYTETCCSKPKSESYKNTKSLALGLNAGVDIESLPGVPQSLVDKYESEDIMIYVDHHNKTWGIELSDYTSPKDITRDERLYIKRTLGSMLPGYKYDRNFSGISLPSEKTANESIKESKEEDLTADEIAYKKYQDGEYTYQDYVDVCTQEECEPLPEIKESIEEAKDSKFCAYMILDDKFDELDTPVDSEFEEKGLHTIDDIKEYVKKTYPNAKRIVKMCYTFDNEQMKECEDEFEIINLDDAKVEEKVGASKESAHKEPENKPEGNWAWDKDACDWYDKDTDTFHSETIKEEVVEESIEPETYVEDMEGFDDIDFLEESIFDAPIITDLFGDYDC